MTDFASIYEPATIVSPNPLPADIDWQRVENTLGVKIEQGSPSLLVDQRDRNLLGAVPNPVGSIREFSNLVRVGRVPEFDGLAGSNGNIAASFVEGFLLGRHDASIQSVDETPEPSDVEGVASSDSKKCGGCSR